MTWGGVDFDVRARLTHPPTEDTEDWLLVCRRCGFHVEIERGCSWRGCPDCNAPLWAIFPEGSGYSPMPAELWHESFKPRRRRNAWRNARLTFPLDNAQRTGAS